MGKASLSVLGVLMALCLVIGSVSAISIPTPISGKIIQSGDLAGYEVKITNLDSRNQDSMTVTTNDEGWFTVDWLSTGFTDFATGDNFKIEVGGVVKQFTFIDKIDYTMGSIYDLRGIVEPKEITCPTCPTCPVVTEPTCPTVPTCPEPEIPTQAQCNVLYPTETPTCPDTPCDQNESLAALLGVLGGLGAGVGVVYVKLGKTAQHMHKGIANYHSIYTSHSNKDIRHPRGELAPKYVQLNGVWKYTK
jgi:hypothetical protein